MGYLTAFQITEALTGLAVSFPSLCTMSQLDATDGGFSVIAVTLHDPSVKDRTPVLVIGGVHAREWAPPDALIGLVQRLLTSRTSNTDIVYPKFSSGGVPYSDPNYTISAADVATMFDKLELIFVPLVNPDGRNFSQDKGLGDPMWRKSRRQVVAAGPKCVGVDLNRNFPLGWYHRVYYNPTAAATVAVSEDPCHFEIYKGPDPASEIETQNIMGLVASRKVRAFVDVHMTARDISFPWAMERNQEINPNAHFANTNFDHKDPPAPATSGRDGLFGDVYGEFMPPALHQRLKTIAAAMSAEILASAGAHPLARRRSKYTVGQSVLNGFTRTETFVGCSDDYAFSRQFVDPAMPECVAFTVEAGLDETQSHTNPKEHDGGFHPLYDTQYPKVEREIHAALFGLFKAL